jgi:ribosomal protein S12 methylthiotransferase
MEEQSVISYQINQTLIGSIQEVLIEGKSEIPDHPYVGRCSRQAPEIDGVTYVKGKNLSTGCLVQCKITGTTEYDLFAEVVT